MGDVARLVMLTTTAHFSLANVGRRAVAWRPGEQLPNMTELNTKGYENLELHEERRYWQLMSRRKIKEGNATTHL